MKRILHEITIGKIAAVDRPCQAPAIAVIMKRRTEPPEPGMEGVQAPDGADWPKRRENALVALQKLAEDRATAAKIPVAAAWADVLATPDGARLYGATI